MLAYAANRPAPVDRRPYPNAMLVIIAVHVAGIAAVMSAKMDLPERFRNIPIPVDLIPQPKPPEAKPQTNNSVRPQTITQIDRVDPFVPIKVDSTPVTIDKTIPDAGPQVGPRKAQKKKKTPQKP
jgi:hypothetical protein